MAADIATTLNAWSSTSSSNQPDTSDPVGPNTLAQNLQVIQSVMRAASAGDGTIASATTTDLSTVNDGDITVTGTTTITGFGTLTAGIKKVLTFSGTLILTHNATSLILPGAANITTAAGDVAIMRSLGSGNWKCIAFTRSASLPATAGANADITSMTALTAPTAAANPIRATDLQVQLVTAFTTGGTGTAFTLTPTPALSANAAKVRYNPTLSADPSGSPTLAVSGLTALNFKYYDANGAKQFVTTAQAKSGMSCDVVNDGTDWVLLNPLPRGVASTAEAQAFTNTVNTITPSTLGLAMKGGNQNLASAGYQKLPGGLILQWGVSTVTTGTPLAITFPLAFPTATYSLILGLYSPSGTGNTVYSSAVTTSGGTLNVAGTAGASTVYWQAIGS